MQERDALKIATECFRHSFPSISPEAILAFLVAADTDRASIDMIAQTIGHTDPDTRRYLSQLQAGSGFGLIRLVSDSDGATYVQLTDTGLSLVTEIETAYTVAAIS
ncbi:hypothetical protein GCM10017044_11880 [Kordiimonas sediminis]|uniref:Uncharacterized protein n=1 Tax=Kordiimonas sediminis TaxID=1735581 RepID=A0A919E4I2_9PROT|nr:hypothetical protein [Kordiimonas sediminis]GHF18952.1 hypothetical protein GCM10017044_11880 [Kordiimonas sediminis]